MNIEIRFLEQGDDDVLNRTADVFDDPVDQGATREFLADPRHKLVVALDEQTVVGFVSAVLYVHPDDPRPELWINEVGVAASHHGRGIAKELMRAMLDAGRRANCSAAWVLTSRSNIPAMRLYASVGGEEAAEDSVMFTFPLDRC